MASPADRQVEANATLDELAEGIAELAAEIHPQETVFLGEDHEGQPLFKLEIGIDRWANMSHEERDKWRSSVRLMIQEGTLIPPKPKSTGPAPMDGQEALDATDEVGEPY